MNFGGFFHLAEQFDKVTDFLLNPEHRDKTFKELEQEFLSSGGRFLGGGQFGLVYEHPSWPYVIKIFPHDDCYIRFVRMAYRHIHSSFPKFYGLPQQIVPFFRRDASRRRMYVVRTEKLYPVKNRAMLKLAVDNADAAQWYFDVEKHKAHDNFDQYSQRQYDHYVDIFEQYPQLKPLLEGWGKINILRCAADLKEDNIMQRQNGELVWVDPVWYGESPYETHARLMRAEVDDWEDPEPPQDIPGGRLNAPKKPRYNPPKSVSHPGDNEVPFWVCGCYIADMKLTSQFILEADKPTKCKRIYPREILEQNVARLQAAVEGRGLMGEIEHPGDSIIHFANVSHLITKLEMQDDKVIADIETLDTPCGKILEGLLKDGVDVQFMPRGVGNGQVNENEILVVDSYKLITIDAVAPEIKYDTENGTWWSYAYS